MNVKHCLPSVRVAVRHHAVATLGHAEVPGDGPGRGENVPDDGLVLRGEIVEGLDVFLGNDEKVGGRGGVDVRKRQADIVLKEDLGRDLPAYDFAEDAFAHRSSLPARCVPRVAVGGQFIKAFWVASLAFLLTSCASVSAPSSKDLQGVVKRFHHDLRWKYYDEAAARVNPEHSQAFLDEVEDEKNALNISTWEIRKVEMLKEGTEAKIRVQFKYYRMPSTVVQTETAEQTWRKLGEGWFLFGQEKGPFVLPPPGGSKKDPGAPEDASSP
jgi:hypothetical protein